MMSVDDCLNKKRFYRAMLCIRGTSHWPVSVSVTSRSSTKTAKRRIIQTTPHDTKDLHEIRPGSPPTRAPNAGGVVKIGDFRQITAISRKRYKIDT